MADVKLVGGEIKLRSFQITRPLLKQFRVLDRLPKDWFDFDNGCIKDEYAIGWVHISVVDKEPFNADRCIILVDGNGNAYQYRCWTSSLDKRAWVKLKQIYV